jgi:hypothetical protein
VHLFIPSSDITCHCACQCRGGDGTPFKYKSLWSVSVYSCVYPQAQAQCFVLIPLSKLYAAGVEQGAAVVVVGVPAGAVG